MTPLEAYRDIAARARHLLLLHDGLTNTRQRRIRRDWKESFCRLMHWRLDTSLERVDSRDSIIILRQGASLAPADFTGESLADLLRASITFGVSALDRYVHERVVKGIVTALNAPSPTRQQEELAIPATVAIRITQQIAKARTAGRQVRPANAVRNEIQELLHKRPFQSWRDLEYAFSLIGITDFETRMKSAWGVTNISPYRDKLNRLVQQRNYIVHEGHLVRHQRAGKVRAHTIKRKYVADSLDFLDDLVDHLEKA